eukprot:TRINITY_DN91_c0_g2_i1.p2 TRINITY_DN91_c0_g2~~TRINITY_DN91_c0_g2_i1.p2  ORF type:complete len:169 (-),score=7.90 TRINITY_DN91_c0_g2_i1:799-1260(-)
MFTKFRNDIVQVCPDPTQAKQVLSFGKLTDPEQFVVRDIWRRACDGSLKESVIKAAQSNAMQFDETDSGHKLYVLFHSAHRTCDICSLSILTLRSLLSGPNSEYWPNLNSLEFVMISPLNYWGTKMLDAQDQPGERVLKASWTLESFFSVNRP